MNEHSGQAQGSALQESFVSGGEASTTPARKFSRSAQLLAGAAVCGVLVWSVAATALLTFNSLEGTSATDGKNSMRTAYEMRIAALTEERNELLAALSAYEDRYAAAMETISTQKSSLLEVAQTRSDLKSALEAARAQLGDAVAARNAAEAGRDSLRQQIAALSNSEDDHIIAEELARTLDTMTATLDAVTRDRDTAHASVEKLETEVASMELTMQIASERQEQMVANLEDAVEMTFKPLESVFERSGLDLESLVSTLRPQYSGFGGDTGPIMMGTRNIDDPELSARFAAVMEGMDKMNLMRIAATKVPYAMPVSASHRYTSGFGTRRDPKTGGRRAHNGIDLAAPRGTHIHATAEGVVVFAGRQSGFGNLIKIRHEFGFETLYAHLNKIHVNVGDRIARGDHIGDMGTTGRSTGVHLHYEVRVGGKPVNPMTYIKAAKDVF
ncbi:DUF5930 domain-containing protein [Algicella marina]|uniref:Peptidoglycan DD-metalloendopeptidase family protein n=1 Tax=Algicella marina TaxID=2683284 RepID=A0A6P1SVD6_9RHOB|nr:DUF5930 domain-containing protein [Algicella marina]QHQ34654.1 peptidoglycan DD-metalloendopeptidase family protein [Algicella marina]